MIYVGLLLCEGWQSGSNIRKARVYITNIFPHFLLRPAALVGQPGATTLPNTTPFWRVAAECMRIILRKSLYIACSPMNNDKCNSVVFCLAAVGAHGMHAGRMYVCT